MKDVPSDVVELIIAVDLDPKNPSEPINVTSVDASEGKGKGQCPMCAKLFKAIGKMDPEADAIVKSGLDDEGKISAIEKLAAGAPSEAQDEADSFDKAMGHKMMAKSPDERYGMPKPPKEDFHPRPSRPEGDFGKPKPDEPGNFRFPPEGGNVDFEPKKKSNFGGFHPSSGFHGASDRAFGKQPQDQEDFQDHGTDEDQEDQFGNKKRWRP
jgi:hypothetical protein